jgi:hypothetical protein
LNRGGSDAGVIAVTTFSPKDRAVSMAELDEALRLIEQNPDEADFIGPRDEGLIVGAEFALRITFPPTYRRFLLELGEGTFGGGEFFGAISQDLWDARLTDGIGQSLQARERRGLSTSMVLVSNDGTGGYFALNTAQRGENDENPVVYWEPGRHQPGDKLDIVAPDFGCFFRDEIRMRLRE